MDKTVKALSEAVSDLVAKLEAKEEYAQLVKGERDKNANFAVDRMEEIVKLVDEVDELKRVNEKQKQKLKNAGEMIAKLKKEAAESNVIHVYKTMDVPEVLIKAFTKMVELYAPEIDLVDSIELLTEQGLLYASKITEGRPYSMKHNAAYAASYFATIYGRLADAGVDSD